MELKKLSNQAFKIALDEKVKKEKKATAELIEYLAEALRRKLYLELGYASLFEMLVKNYNYCKGSAQIRLNNAKAALEDKSIIDKLEEGKLNISQVSMAVSAMNQATMTDGTIFNTESKRELFSKIENKSQEESEKILAKELHLPVIHKEITKHQADDSVQISMTFTKEEYELLNQVKGLMSHATCDHKLSSAIVHLAKRELKRRTESRIRKNPVHESAKEAKRDLQDQDVTNKSASKTRSSDFSSSGEPTQPQPSFPQRTHIPAPIKKAVLKRDNYQCQYKDKHTGHKCCSTHHPQVDHKIPVWAYGTNDIDNLQVLCAQHNQHKYRQESFFT